jgi:hypothetical protein
VAVEYLKRRRQEEKREQYNYVVLNRPGTLCPLPIPHPLRDGYARAIEPASALAAETLVLKRALGDLVNQAYALTPAEVTLMWQTATPRKPAPPPGYRKTQVLRCPLIWSVTWVRSMPTTVAPLTRLPTYTVWPFTIAAGLATV